MKKKYIIVAACCFAIIAAFTFYYFFTPLNAEGKTAYIYIDNDDNIDSVINKIRPHSRAHAMKAYTTLVRHSHYAEHIRPGRYALDPHTSTFNTFRSAMPSTIQAYSVISGSTILLLQPSLSPTLMMYTGIFRRRNFSCE